MSPSGDADNWAEHVERDAQTVDDDRVGAPCRRHLDDLGAAIANAAALDDDALDDRPCGGTGEPLGLAHLVAGVQRRLGDWQSWPGAEAAGADSFGRHRAQRIEAGALVQAAQGFADKPTNVVELWIMRGEHAMNAHHV